MKKPNEDDILETTLSIAEKGYPEAYRFLLNAYEESPSSFGPQTFYFLACLADGPGAALAWLRKAIQENNWWYRPEGLEEGSAVIAPTIGSIAVRFGTLDGFQLPQAACSHNRFPICPCDVTVLCVPMNGQKQVVRPFLLP